MWFNDGERQADDRYVINIWEALSAWDCIIIIMLYIIITQDDVAQPCVKVYPEDCQGKNKIYWRNEILEGSYNQERIGSCEHDYFAKQWFARRH